jgi:hypothetical protein
VSVPLRGLLGGGGGGALRAAEWRRQPWAYAASLDDVAVRFQEEGGATYTGCVRVCATQVETAPSTWARGTTGARNGEG